MTTSSGPGPYPQDPDHRQLRIDVGAYVLGALAPAEADRLERHLSDCEECRAELAELSGLPPALGLLTDADLADVVDLADLDRLFDTATPDVDRPVRPPVGDLAERAVVSLAAYRRSVRRRVALAVAGVAAAAALVLGVTVLNQPASLTVSASGGAITASVKLTNNAGGSAVVLRLNGVRPHQVGALVEQDTDGRRQTAATWVANYEGEAEVHGQSGLTTGQVASLTVLGDGDVPLLTVPVRNT